MARTTRPFAATMFAAVALTAALAAGPGAAPAQAARRCSAIKLGGFRLHVTIKKGHVRCHTARRILRAFLSGKGTLHGPAGGPASEQTWTLGRWSCGRGAGGGACFRHGRDYRRARDYIVALGD